MRKKRKKAKKKNTGRIDSHPDSGPVPVLEVKEYSQGITITLLFRYGETIIPHDPGIPPVVVIDGNRIKPDKAFQQTMYNYIKEMLKKNIVREYSSSSCSSYHFSVEYPFQQMLVEIGDNIFDRGFELRLKGKAVTFKKAWGLSFHVKRNMDWFDIKTGIIDSGGNCIDIPLSRDMIKNNLVRVNESFYILTKKDIEKLKTMMFLGAEENGMVKISQYNYHFLDVFYKDIRNRNEAEIDSIKKSIDNLKTLDSIRDIPEPLHFRGKLRDYQKAGVNWLYFLYRYNVHGCLADDMGLGKTVQTLALLQKLKEEKLSGQILIVTPVSTLANWEDETKRFTPKLKYSRHHGTGRSQDISSYRTTIIFTSYHTLRNDIDIFLKHSFSYIILDESQKIKNPASMIFRAVRLLQARHRLCLSGTPVENNTVEIWAQMDFLMPGLLGKQKEFIETFSKPIEESEDRKKAALLRNIIFPFILRRKKEDVEKELPDKEEILLYVDMDTEQKKIYDELKIFFKTRVLDTMEEKGIKRSAIHIFTALLKLRQAALFPHLVDKKYKDIPSAKFELFKDITSDILAEGHKLLVFSQFISCLKEFRDYFESLNIAFSYIDGSTKNRDIQIHQFQNKKDIPVFLLSLKAGGIGINLTVADYVIIYDPWWNPAVETQAIDRAHRIGQVKKVIAYKIITKETVEEKIIRLQEKKKKIASEIITTEKTFFKSLGQKEIMNLFS